MTPFENAIAVRTSYESNKKKVKATDLKSALSAMDVSGCEKVKKADCYDALCQIISLRDGGFNDPTEYAHLEAQYNMAMFPNSEPEIVVEPEPEVVQSSLL